MSSSRSSSWKVSLHPAESCKAHRIKNGSLLPWHVKQRAAANKLAANRPGVDRCWHPAIYEQAGGQGSKMGARKARVKTYGKEDFKAFLEEEKKKTAELSFRKKLEYIWQYYKLWITGFVCAVSLAAYLVVHFFYTPRDNWFYGVFANTYADAGEHSRLWEGFVEYAHLDVKEKNVVFNNNCFFDPAKDSYNQYYNAFVAYVDSKTMDIVTMETEDLQALGEKGRLMDLSNVEIAGSLAEKYADRLVYALPDDTEYSKEPIPIGIDLSDTCLVTEFQLYGESCALGVSALAPHLDKIELFLEYVLNWEGLYE